MRGESSKGRAGEVRPRLPKEATVVFWRSEVRNSRTRTYSPSWHLPYFHATMSSKPIFPAEKRTVKGSLGNGENE